MKKYISEDEIFIQHEQRSTDKYYPQLSAYVRARFAAGSYQDDDTVKKIIETYYDWCADKFLAIIHSVDDSLFAYYMLSYHESSILLWMRVVGKENIEAKFGIPEEDLAMNRRIFKLIMEQFCDMNFAKRSDPSHQLAAQFDETIEDLLYIGMELYNAANFLAESKMIPGSLYAVIEPGALVRIRRKGNCEQVFSVLIQTMNADFAKGIVDAEGVTHLKAEIKKAFAIGYDFAASQIVQIKKQLAPHNWQWQTIEPGILVQNLIHNGVKKEEAINFYEGLTLNKENKLPIRDSIYRVNSMERYFFSPILEIFTQGERRQLIGINKWAESITVLATNNFQWNKAPGEWKNNKLFNEYLDKKSNEHDALLENEVMKVLDANNLPYQRNIVYFDDGKKAKNFNVPGVGEIDFIWIDPVRKRVVVADCKYNRARYDMISFTADYSNFVNAYEKKISGKAKWVEENLKLIGGHFVRQFPDLKIDIHSFQVEELFIINTPTLYMYLNRTNTVSFFNLEEFILNGYIHPDITLEVASGNKTSIKVQPYPYLKYE